MLEFTFFDQNGQVLLQTVKKLSPKCGGGCCFDKAVAEFRLTVLPTFVPGQPGITIQTKGI